MRFQGGKIEPPRIAEPRAAGLDVRVGATQRIVPGEYLSMFKFADGSLVVGDHRSSDHGKTWQPAVSFHAGAYQFPDGEIVELGFRTKRSDRDGYFTTALRRSADNGRTAKTETALLHVPEGTGGTDDDGQPSEGPAVDHAIVRLHDGSLLAAMYGCFKSDRVLIPTMPAAWRCYKYRTFVIRSTDRGKTWEYLSTVAYDPSVGLESFCEGDLLTLPGGDILCFMRTGGSGGRHTPLYLSRSHDDGKTWSTPAPVADRGVWPNACRMQNGVIACTYGRPGNWLTFSLDEGRTWRGHFCFHEGSTCSYNSVEEITPGEPAGGLRSVAVRRGGQRALGNRRHPRGGQPPLERPSTGTLTHRTAILSNGTHLAVPSKGNLGQPRPMIPQPGYRPVLSTQRFLPSCGKPCNLPLIDPCSAVP